MRRRPRKFLKKKERQIENQNRRAALKIQLLKAPESAQKRERHSERWDIWWYD
jgi:hypothetical protein